MSTLATYDDNGNLKTWGNYAIVSNEERRRMATAPYAPLWNSKEEMQEHAQFVGRVLRQRFINE